MFAKPNHRLQIFVLGDELMLSIVDQFRGWDAIHNFRIDILESQFQASKNSHVGHVKGQS